MKAKAAGNGTKKKSGSISLSSSSSAPASKKRRTTKKSNGAASTVTSIIDVSTSDPLFRQELLFEQRIQIGQIRKASADVMDEDFASIRRRFLYPSSWIPEDSTKGAGMKPSHVKAIVEYVRMSKSTAFKKRGEGTDMDDEEYDYLTEAWSGLFKLPTEVAKLSGKNESTWRANVGAKYAKMLLRDFDDVLEEEREVVIPFLKKKSHPVFVLGLQKNREMRDLLATAKQYDKRKAACGIGQTILPFFAVQEYSDRVTQFQAENELACVLKVLLDCNLKFFGDKSKKFVLGMTSVGPVPTVYAMRKLPTSPGEGENEPAMYVLQTVQSFNLNVPEDAVRLGRLLDAVRMYGIELIEAAKDVVKQLATEDDDEDLAEKTEEEDDTEEEEFDEEEVAEEEEEEDDADEDDDEEEEEEEKKKRKKTKLAAKGKAATTKTTKAAPSTTTTTKTKKEPNGSMTSSTSSTAPATSSNKEGGSGSLSLTPPSTQQSPSSPSVKDASGTSSSSTASNNNGNGGGNGAAKTLPGLQSSSSSSNANTTTSSSISSNNPNNKAVVVKKRDVGSISSANSVSGIALSQQARLGANKKAKSDASKDSNNDKDDDDDDADEDEEAEKDDSDIEDEKGTTK